MASGLMVWWTTSLWTEGCTGSWPSARDSIWIMVVIVKRVVKNITHFIPLGVEISLTVYALHKMMLGVSTRVIQDSGAIVQLATGSTGIISSSIKIVRRARGCT